MVFVPPPKTGAIQIRIHLYINICFLGVCVYIYTCVRKCSVCVCKKKKKVIICTVTRGGGCCVCARPARERSRKKKKRKLPKKISEKKTT